MGMCNCIAKKAETEIDLSGKGKNLPVQSLNNSNKF